MTVQASKLKALLKPLSRSKSESLRIADIGFGSMACFAMDNELSIRNSMEVDGIEPGSITVPLRKTISFLNKLSGEVTLEIGQALKVKSNRVEATIEARVDDVRMPPMSANANIHEVEYESLLAGLNYVLKATNPKEGLFGYGILLDTDCVVSAARNRFASAPSRVGLNGLVLPEALARAFSWFAGNKTVQIVEEVNTVALIAGSLAVAAKRPSESYPDYKKRLPTDYPFEAIIKTSELRESLDRLAPLLDEQDNISPLILNFTKNTLLIAEQNNKASDCVSYDGGGSLTVTINHRFLAEFLETVTEDTFVFTGRDVRSPVLCRAGEKIFMMSVL